MLHDLTVHFDAHDFDHELLAFRGNDCYACCYQASRMRNAACFMGVYMRQECITRNELGEQCSLGCELGTLTAKLTVMLKVHWPEPP